MLRAMTRGDWIVCAVVTIGSVALAASARAPSRNAHAFAVRVGHDVVLRGSLADDARYPVEGRTGPLVVEVAHGAVRIAESNCPQQVCVGMGAKRHAGDWIACVPNAVAVQLVGGRRDPDAPDAITR
jgi:hypothetical protein